MGSSDEKKIREKARKIRVAREIRLREGIKEGQRNLEGKKVTVFELLT